MKKNTYRAGVGRDICPSTENKILFKAQSEIVSVFSFDADNEQQIGLDKAIWSENNGKK